MRKLCIFFLLLVLAAGCEEETPGPGLLGTWEISWITEGEVLTGNIIFNENKAILKAYGHEGSMLLKEQTGMQYAWKMHSDTLVLIPLDHSLILEYQVVNKTADQWNFLYLGDIEVKISRVNP